MATLNEIFTNIANAIRSKKGTTNKILPANMPTEIESIEGGGNNLLQTLVTGRGNWGGFYLCYQYKGYNVDFLAGIDFSATTDMSYMFSFCSYPTTIPLLNTSNVTNMNSMFNYASNLTTIPALDVSKVTSMSNMFRGCTNLKSILMTGMSVAFDISASTKFEASDLVVILNNLATVTSSKTLKMGSTNLAKLTDEEKAIATNKGWTLA